MRVVLEIVGGLSLGLAAWLGGSRLAEPPSLQPRASSSAAAPAAPSGSAAAALAPPRAGGPSDDGAPLRAHADPVASYTLTARLDPAAHVVDGTGSIVWKNASRTPQRALWLHLYLNAFKNERTLFMRTPGSGFRGASSLTDWGYVEVRRLYARELEAELWPPPGGIDGEDDATDVRVPLPREVAPGESITLDVAFRSHLPSITLRTGYFGGFHMVAQWFPKIARLEPDGRWAHFPFTRFSEFYADFGAYDVTVDVPAGFVVGASGRRTSFVSGGGREVSRFVQEDIHDFAFAAWDGFREKTATVDGVALRCLYPPGYDATADVELDSARFGLAHFGAAYGRYPYPELTLVHPPAGAEEAGGMEYPTLITTGGPWLMPWTGVRLLEIVTIHELGHQWFYGLVATDEHEHPFLDEGVNSYAEAEAMEAMHPGSSLADLPGLRLGLPAAYRFGSVHAVHDGAPAQSVDEFATGSDYGALVYSRTATILETLARVWGRDRMRRALGRYARRYRFEHPGPAELVAAIGEEVGEDAALVARTALFDGGWVDFTVESIASSPVSAPLGIFGDPAHPSIAPAPPSTPSWTGSVLVRRRGTLTLPVEVELLGADGSARRVPWDGRASWARLPYEGPSPLAAAVIDPGHRALLDGNLSNDAVGGDQRIAPRVLELASFAAAVALNAVAP